MEIRSHSQSISSQTVSKQTESVTSNFVVTRQIALPNEYINVYVNGVYHGTEVRIYSPLPLEWQEI